MHSVDRRRISWVSALLTVAVAMGVVGPVLAAFQTHQTFATGSFPWSVAVGDVNGDGKPDLAVANLQGSTVSVLRNTTPTGATTPAFALQQTFPVGDTARSVAMVDVNGDGKSDLAVANDGNDTVSVLLNTTALGASTLIFGPQQTFGTASEPRSVAVGDVNGDGSPDLAIANGGSASVSVLLNTTGMGSGTPTFTTHQTFGTGSSPYSVAIGDMNGDGKPDLAVANNQSDTVSVLLNTTITGGATPTFATQQPFATGSGPYSVAVGDLNGDGKPDLAVANSGLGSNSVSVLLNTTPTGGATPTFSAQQPFSTGTSPHSVAVGDLNGDGKPDLAVANNGAAGTGITVSVLRNTTSTGAGTPSFALHQTFTTGTGPEAVAVGDINVDGRADLAVANSFSNTVSVLLGNPSGTLQFLGASAVSVAEGGGQVTLTLGRTGSPDGQVSAIVSVTGGTATTGTDFTFTAPQTVTWPDGDGTNKTVTVPIIQDQIVEADETIQFTLSLPTNPFGAVLGAQTTRTVTITNDDSFICQPRPPVRVAVSAADANTLNVTVTAGVGSLTEFRFLGGAAAQVPASNALVDIGTNLGRTGDFTFTPAANSTTQTFTIRRAALGLPTTLQFDAVDGCGPWRSLAGGGAGPWSGGI